MQSAGNSLVRAAVAMALLVWTVMPATAQTQYSDQKLEAFVEAAIQVSRLSSEWQQRIAGANDETEANELRNEAGRELVAAVESTEGISLDEYNQISEEARTDPELSERIGTILEEQQVQ